MVEIKKVVLDRLRFGLQSRVSHEVLQAASSLSVEEMVDRVTGDLAIRLMLEVFGDELHRDEIRYPATWIDGMLNAFYQIPSRYQVLRWLKRKMRQKWPVRWTVIKLVVRELYPTLSPSLPNHQPQLVIATMKPETKEGKRDYATESRKNTRVCNEN